MGASGHSFASLQARLNQTRSSDDRGETLPLTAKALGLEDEAERLVQLVAALSQERVIAPAIVESSDECKASVLRVNTEEGPAVVAMSSVDALQHWNPNARPVPIPGYQQAMIAVAETEGRLVIDPDGEGKGVRIPRPATHALAHGDQWLPPWRDKELKAALENFRDDVIAYVSIIPSPGATQIIMVGVNPRGIRQRGRVVAALDRMSELPRLATACERVEFRPIAAHLA
ncbi:MAG: SseB family protein [Actinomycetaceae bacterium]|nr:SseB family protein [Actinomycetaceae bacterium]